MVNFKTLSASCIIFFKKILALITWIEQKEFLQQWGLSPEYPDHFFKNYNYYTIESLYFMHYWLWPICPIHLIDKISLFWKKAARDWDSCNSCWNDWHKLKQRDRALKMEWHFDLCKFVTAKLAQLNTGMSKICNIKYFKVNCQQLKV